VTHALNVDGRFRYHQGSSCPDAVPEIGERAVEERRGEGSTWVLSVLAAHDALDHEFTPEGQATVVCS
jgi:hypothetical protein